MCHTVDQRNRKHGGDQEALVHRAHHVRTIAETNEESADDRGHDAGPADQQRKRHQRKQQVAHRCKQQSGQHHCDPDGHDIGFEQVGSHAGAVTHVVSNVVGDNRRVAGIVFRDASFDLADKVSADVGSLGKDAAAQTCEDRHQRRTQCERGKADNHFLGIGGIACRTNQVVEEPGDREQRQTSDEHPGDGTGAERHGQTLLKPRACCLRGADVRADRDVHPDVARDTRKDSADDKASGRNPAEEHAHEHGDDHADDADGLVLTV